MAFFEQTVVKIKLHLNHRAAVAGSRQDHQWFLTLNLASDFTTLRLKNGKAFGALFEKVSAAFSSWLVADTQIFAFDKHLASPLTTQFSLFSCCLLLILLHIYLFHSLQHILAKHGAVNLVQPHLWGGLSLVHFTHSEQARNIFQGGTC